MRPKAQNKQTNRTGLLGPEVHQGSSSEPVESQYDFLHGTVQHGKQQQEQVADNVISGHAGQEPPFSFVNLDKIGGSNADAPMIDKEVEIMAVLLEMGFEGRDVQDALKRCSSMEAAVEFLMLRGSDFALRQQILRERSSGIAHKLDQAGQVALGHLAQPFLLPCTVVPNGSPFGPVVSKGSTFGPPQDLFAELLSLGFAEAQARAAARRCSSIEAAVGWIGMHPDLTD